MESSFSRTFRLYSTRGALGKDQSIVPAPISVSPFESSKAAVFSFMQVFLSAKGKKQLFYCDHFVMLAGLLPPQGRGQNPRRHPRSPRVYTYKEFQKCKDVSKSK